MCPGVSWGNKTDRQFGVRENSNNALTGTRHFIGTKLIVQPNDTDFKKVP